MAGFGKIHGVFEFPKNHILDSEWGDECIDFTMMCVFFKRQYLSACSMGK